LFVQGTVSVLPGYRTCHPSHGISS